MNYVCEFFEYFYFLGFNVKLLIVCFIYMVLIIKLFFLIYEQIFICYIEVIVLINLY